MTKNIFNWNHISSDLTEDQIEELKSYYITYHRKCWAYKQAAKRFKKWKLLGDSLSIIFATGGIASAIATSGISLVAISTASVIIQSWMKRPQNAKLYTRLPKLPAFVKHNQRYHERWRFSTAFSTHNNEQRR